MLDAAVTAKRTHRRFANKKSFELFKNGKSLGYFLTDQKKLEDEKEDLKDFVEMTGADKIVLHWSAREGFIDEEVIL